MSFVRHTYHIIFSTKNREKVIAPDLRPELYAYMGGIIKKAKGVPIAIGGVSDHVHILAKLHQSIAVADVIRDLKSGSSHWVNAHHKVPAHFAWQTKYGSFAVSRSMEEQVAAYIRNQEEHHRTTSFQEEFMAFLRKHDIPFDTHFMWE